MVNAMLRLGVIEKIVGMGEVSGGAHQGWGV